jgi:glycerophosphoryl diester phosphodiesterase
MPAVKRVGHKGAHLIAPGNTADSFDAALAAGVDMIEFDVLSTRDGRIVLAHDWADADRREPMTLEEGLDHFATDVYAGVELDVDMKLTGYEREVVEGLRARGLLDRTLISSHYLESLDQVTRLAPGTRRGLSVPKVKRDYTKGPLALPAYGIARYMRARLPAKMAALARTGRIDAVMAHWLLASRALVESMRAENAEVYIWTIDDPRRIEKIAALGVDGVITNDPRLFGSLADLAKTL